MKLKDRRAIITGGGRGIGRAYVERFLDEGAHVAILDLDIERAEKTAAELADRGEVFAVRADVGDEDSVNTVVADVAARLGGIDIVVNNAAIFGDWKPRDDTFDYLKKITDVNLLGAWLVTRAAAPHLVKSPYGRVINQSSTNAYSYTYTGPTDEFPGLRSYSYAWTKYGTNGLTKYTAAQLGNWGVTVNAVAPGVIFTEALLNAVDENRANQLADQQPIKGRIQPSDVAGAVAFLASDDAKFISGQILLVDGGRFMPG
ncbi:short-chain dehydrogenase [Amycolatopsis sp. NBRC 101858]|uniref:SDR family NAD(P)-dependent oxidoreductase n=1 Tax=Amycolatopsis sp. NBRC 101858 TaxID=3032200 RepID=UPI0024A1E7C1|nr:SDR family oxidoreductase [Amycolatopsis sp. NBRC 101858]GLY38878.1 short-chain dehydrogenase [Amycolatopsis sp. NBRC 101858]